MCACIANASNWHTLGGKAGAPARAFTPGRVLAPHISLNTHHLCKSIATRGLASKLASAQSGGDMPGAAASTPLQGPPSAPAAPEPVMGYPNPYKQSPSTPRGGGSVGSFNQPSNPNAPTASASTTAQQQPPTGIPPGYPNSNPFAAPAGASAPGQNALGGWLKQTFGAKPQPAQGYPATMPAQPSMMPRQQQPAMMAATAPGGMASAILAKLNQIVTVNQLQRFYSPRALESLANSLDNRVNFRELAARWRMPVELALDLSSLALYDIILFADDSGSMAFEENGERIDDLKLVGNKVAEIATLFDDDGIVVRFMNSNVQADSVRSATDVDTLLASVQFTGLTPLATAMESKVLQPIVYNLANRRQLQKPVLVITITDGEPTDTPRDLIIRTIKEARARLEPKYGPKAVAFEFAQVGKDQRAQAFLGRLDVHPEVGNSIDCTSYFEMESVEYQRRGIQLSPEMWLVKMMVGAIDPEYDEADE